MTLRRLLVAVFASALFLPVSCSLVTLPVTQLLAKSGERDLTTGEEPHLSPAVPMSDSAAAGAVVLVPLQDLAARRAATQTLTAWLPVPEGAEGEGEDRSVWRLVAATASRREMEVVHVAENYTHTFRYAVTADGTVTPLHSKLYSIGHLFSAIPIGMVVAFVLFGLARSARRRGVAAPAGGA